MWWKLMHNIQCFLWDNYITLDRPSEAERIYSSSIIYPHLCLQGLNRQQKDKPDQSNNNQQQQQRNVLWLYDLSTRQWSCVSNYPSSHHINTSSSSSTTANISATSSSSVTQQLCEPSPRFAHQLVYDHVKKVSELSALTVLLV